jgi:hypothetical protein
LRNERRNGFPTPGGCFVMIRFFHCGPKSIRSASCTRSGGAARVRMLISFTVRMTGISGHFTASRVTSVPSAIFGYRLSGGSLPSRTQSSIAT